MKDKWMNMGYEDDDLKPYIEPIQDWADSKRIEILQVAIKPGVKKSRNNRLF